MTNRRYRRQTTDRQLSDARERLRVAEHGNPRPTFRASIGCDDLSADLDATLRRPYFAYTADTVFWNHWDPDYNPQFFDPTFQVEQGNNCVGAVELLIPGIYGIRASVDPTLEDFANFTFTVPGANTFNLWLGGNYDDAGVTHILMDPGSAHHQLVHNELRILWSDFASAESSVEITFNHDNVADEPLFLPGGFCGYLGSPSLLTIVYLGGLDSATLYDSDAVGV